MTPTLKLVIDMVACVQSISFIPFTRNTHIPPPSMQACYVNTTHPDFINGHKAMSLVSDRLNSSKPQGQPADGRSVDPKTGKLLPGAINNNKDLDVDLKREEPGFFGSFFVKGKPQAGMKKGPVMEAPPAVIRPQAALNERETMETEVISYVCSPSFSFLLRAEWYY